MKKYQFAVHYDMVINVEVVADSIGEAAQIAKDKAARLPMEAAECVNQDACLADDPQELSAQELRSMENEKVRAAANSWFNSYKDPLDKDEKKTLAAVAYGRDTIYLTADSNDPEKWESCLMKSINDGTHPRTAIFERYARMYARRRWQEMANDLRAQWAKAFSKAKADPKTYRVIVETNEREEETGDGDRYFMIDKGDGCGNEYDRWQVIRCDCAASPYDTRTAKAYTVGTQAQPSCEASPNNVTRWAERMINAGRVVSIYADCY